MLFKSEHDLVLLLGVISALLLVICIGAGILAALKSLQVRQFQDLLFKAERKIDTLERRMFNVLNAVPVALVETDNSGKFTFANKAAHGLLGRKDNELIGLRFHSATWGIAFPDGRAIPADMMPIARTLRGQTVKGFQHLITNHGSHEKILVSVTSMPIMNNNGEVIGSTSAMVEIESTAGEGVDDLSGLWRGHWFAAAVMPIWGLDPKGMVVDVNAAALDAFDVKREDVIGKMWAQLFVADGDFQRALDYLGDSQDETTPDHAIATQLHLRDSDGTLVPALISAWAIRTHEGGDHGLTVMALATEEQAAAPQAEAVATAAPLSDDDAQELEDLRNAELALAALGIGVWQYDAEVDTIVEDEGMQRLIGRETPGGPTLISEDDQAVADVEFAKLLSGESDALSMDIRVVQKDGAVHWITLKGQASQVDGQRHIFGVALDSTDQKQPQPTEIVVTPEPATPAITEADLDAARQEALEAARREYEEALEAARTTQSEVYAWGDAPSPVTIHETDPALVAENETLKTRLETLEAELDDATVRHDALQQQIADFQARPEPEASQTVTVVEPDPAVVEENAELKSRLETLQAELADAAVYQGTLQQQIADLEARPEPTAPEPVTVVEADPAVVAENDTLKTELQKAQDELKQLEAANADLNGRLTNMAATPAVDTTPLNARIAALEASLKDSEEARNELQVQMSDILLAPRLVEVKDDRDVQIEGLKAELEAADVRTQGLQAELDVIANTPAPEPDYSEWEQKLATVEFETRKWQAAYDDAQAKLAAVPPPPTVDIDALTGRLEELQASLSQSLQQQSELQDSLQRAHAQQSDMHSRVEQLNAALSNARKYETVGRLTGDVAQDFAQMLGVINGALEILSKQGGNEQVRRLSEAALAAGRRGERLTRQLQAFQSEDY